MIIFENEHIQSTYFGQKKYALNFWKGSQLTDNDFKYAMSSVADLLIGKDLKGILVDTRKFTFTISPEIQFWYDNNIVPKHLLAGAKKMAFLLPEEFIAQISIEQTMSEEKAQQQQTRFFDNYDAAEKWLVG